MLRTLVFGVIAAVAGRQLYKSGALKRFGEDFNRRLDMRRAERGSSSSMGSSGSTMGGTTGMQGSGMGGSGMGGSGMHTPHPT